MIRFKRNNYAAEKLQLNFMNSNRFMVYRYPVCNAVCHSIPEAGRIRYFHILLLIVLFKRNQGQSFMHAECANYRK
jgi:hypothetical protein